MLALTIFGLIFGILLILDGIFCWGLVKVIYPAPKWLVRLSEFVFGGIFVTLAILEFAGAI